MSGFLSNCMNYLKKPYHFALLDKQLNKPGVKVLDIGCGNGSPTRTKRYFPTLQYYGVDRTPAYNNTEEDLKHCVQFWQIDLEKELEKTKQIPDGQFDVIIVNHVVEHLHNGDLMIGSLCSKLAPGGTLYIEAPSEKSLKLPSMAGTLNFYDDPTHVKVWSLSELDGVLKRNGVTVFNMGIRRSLKRIMFFPFYLLIGLKRKQPAGAFWDILGFAHFIVAKK